MPEAARLAAVGDTGRVVGMSFDDGYRDVVENGADVLAEHDAKVTRVRGARRGRRHRAVQLVRAASRRCSGGTRSSSSTATRRSGSRPTRSPIPTCWRCPRTRPAEIARSREQVAERLGRAVEAFCYPAGLYTDRERRLVAEAGFTAAVTCDPGANGPATDALLLHRTAVELRDGLVDFAAKVAGAHDTPLPLRSAYRRLRYGRNAG